MADPRGGTARMQRPPQLTAPPKKEKEKKEKEKKEKEKKKEKKRKKKGDE